MPNIGLRKLRNVYGERFGKPFLFKYDGEEYTVPLQGEVNELTGDVSSGNDLWPSELAEKAAKDMVDRIIIEDEQYWYESIKPRGQKVMVHGGIKLQDEELKAKLLEEILGKIAKEPNGEPLSTKEKMIQNMKLAQSESNEFAGLNQTNGSTYEEIEAKMTWNDIQTAAVENDVKVTNKDETIKGLVAKGYTVK